MAKKDEQVNVEVVDVAQAEDVAQNEAAPEPEAETVGECPVHGAECNLRVEDGRYIHT